MTSPLRARPPIRRRRAVLLVLLWALRLALPLAAQAAAPEPADLRRLERRDRAETEFQLMTELHRQRERLGAFPPGSPEAALLPRVEEHLARQVRRVEAEIRALEEAGETERAARLARRAAGELARSAEDLELSTVVYQAPGVRSPGSVVRSALRRGPRGLGRIRDHLPGGGSEGSAPARPTTPGGHARTVAAGAANWAVAQVGVDVGFRAAESAFRGDLDWKYAVEPLKEPRYWTGVGGSALLGATALHFLSAGLATAGPLGQVVRLAGVFGAAGLGWQLGSGSLSDLDPVHLAATSAGGAVGAVLGLGLGPLGSVVGGMAGSWVAGALLEELRGRPTTVAATRPSPLDEGIGASAATPAVGPPPRETDLPPPRESSTDELLALDRERRAAYQEMLAGGARGERERIRETYERYRAASDRVEARRAAGP